MLMAVGLGEFIVMAPPCWNHHINGKVNILEDKTAIALYGINTNTSGECIDGYVALDKSGDGKIDEIKAYSHVEFSGRAGTAQIPYTRRYYFGEKKFERLKKEYFSYFN